MKKYLILLCALSFSCAGHAQGNAPQIAKSRSMNKPSIYPLKAQTLSGEEFDFVRLKGMKVMIVNTASECGFTPQYEGLEQLYRKYADRLVIIGFPTNDFGSQEPGTNDQIAAFCQKNYGVTFPMMAKITVKGKAIHPVYQFLTQKSKNGLQDSDVEWNFQKYLLNENGELERVLPSKVKPNDPQILSWLENR